MNVPSIIAAAQTSNNNAEIEIRFRAYPNDNHPALIYMTAAEAEHLRDVLTQALNERPAKLAEVASLPA